MNITVIDVLAWSLISIGSIFTVIGSIGLLRLPDVFARLHGSSVIETLGSGSILLGLAFTAGWGLLTAKIIILLIIMFLLNPSSTHAIARAAIHGSRKPWLSKTDT